MKKLGRIISLMICLTLVFAFAACSDTIVAVESVVISETELELNMGESATLTAEVVPADASNQDIVWTSEDSDIATVENGIVTAVDEGMVLIRAASAADDAKYAECEVTVKVVKYTVRFMAEGTAFSTQSIKRGGDATIPTNEPIKPGHEFNGWFTAAAGGTKVTAVNNVTANADYYAQFTEAAGDVVRNFIYEAEHINLYGMSGAGASGSGTGRGMIEGAEMASGDQVVTYLYEEITLTFIVWSNISAESQLFINVGTEGQNSFCSDGSEPGTEVLVVAVNAAVAAHEGFDVPAAVGGVRQFSEGNLGVINLQEGLNYITLTVVPGSSPGLMIDYLRFRTTAILQWHELTVTVDPNTPGYPNLPIS